MVPGMTERDRRAAEMRLCLWLHDAATGPICANPLARTAARERDRRARLLHLAWERCQQTAHAVAGHVQWGERPLAEIGSRSGD